MSTRLAKLGFAAKNGAIRMHARSASVLSARQGKKLHEKDEHRKDDSSQPEKPPSPLENFSASVGRLTPREKLHLALGMLAFSSAGVYFTYYFERRYPADPERLIKFTDKENVEKGLPKSRLDVLFSGDQELRRREMAAILAEDEIEEPKARIAASEGR
ncbi:hypothetical protein BJ742DRAFT_769442 [Cladochytrium replicatum]|nr:hypothetical protein BJ742DRAFT_769442 [Cladochytrium replicatum]